MYIYTYIYYVYMYIYLISISSHTQTHTYTYIYYIYNVIYTSSTAHGGSSKNSKPIGVVGCCESRTAERIH